MVTARFRYDPYGNVTLKNGSSDTPWRFAGAWFDRFPAADATVQRGLYKMGERYYDPRTGRWTQRDPLDQNSDLRQSNRYIYVGGDPANLNDPSGSYGRYDSYQFGYGGFTSSENATGAISYRESKTNVDLHFPGGYGLSTGTYTGEVDPGHTLG